MYLQCPSENDEKVVVVVPVVLDLLHDTPVEAFINACDDVAVVRDGLHGVSVAHICNERESENTTRLTSPTTTSAPKPYPNQLNNRSSSCHTHSWFSRFSRTNTARNVKHVRSKLRSGGTSGVGTSDAEIVRSRDSTSAWMPKFLRHKQHAKNPKQWFIATRRGIEHEVKTRCVPSSPQHDLHVSVYSHSAAGATERVCDLQCICMHVSIR